MSVSGRSQRSSQAGSRPNQTRDSHRSSGKPSIAAMGMAANFIKNIRNRSKGNALHSIAEKDTDDSDVSDGSDGDDFVPRQRYNYEAPEDPQVAANISMIIKYLNDTEIDDTVSQLCYALMNRPELPFNPYPGFTRRLRRHSEKFHMNMKDSKSIRELLENPVYATPIAHVWGSKISQNVWGLHDMVQAVDPKSLQRYNWLIDNMTPKISTIYNEEFYSVQVMISLVGPAVFTGTFYDDPSTVNLRVEYLIFGPDLNRGAQLFIEHILNDVNSTVLKQTPHVFLGMEVPGTHEQFPDSTINDLWTSDMMDKRQKDFESALINSIQKAKPVTMECVFMLDQYKEIYRRGNKQYLFHFVDTRDGQAEEDLVASFGEFPYITAREGIFWKKAHVEAYLSMYMVREERVDFDSVKSYNDPKQVPKPLPPPEQSSDAGRRTVSAAIDGRSGQNPKQGARVSGPQQSLQRKKVLTDGFKVKESAYVPEGWKATAPIRESFQRRVARMHPEADLFKVAHLLLLLFLMDKDTYGAEFAVEMYKLLHSRAAKLDRCIQHNVVLQELIRKYEADDSDSLFVQTQFTEYKEKLLELFDNKLQECSSDLQIVQKALKRMMDDMMETTETGVQILPTTIDTMIKLRSLNVYCSSVLLQLVEDSLAVCPKVDGLIDSLIQNFPEEVDRPQTRQLPIPVREEGVPPKQPIPAEDFMHGVEDLNIIQHDRQSINVQNCIDIGDKPGIMAMEAVLMQYLMDTKVDLMYEHFLSNLLTEQHLPPNPYPRLISLFRQSGMKMNLWGETNDSVITKLVNNSCKLVDAENYIHHLGGCDVYGHQTAFSVTDVANFQKVITISKEYMTTEFPQRRGQFKIAMTFAVSGLSPVYGSMMPYLNHLELHEHCYFKGPMGCHGEAILIYIEIVRNHVLKISNDNTVIVMGLYVGDEARWSLEDIRKKANQFELEISKAIETKQPVYLRMYRAIGWRYLKIVKQLLLHYVENTEDDYRTFFPENQATLYQNAFFSHEKAAFHFQQGGPEDRYNPYSVSNLKTTNVFIKSKIEEYVNKQDYLSVFKWILTRSLINKQHQYLADCYRMLHSTAYQIEYLSVLNETMQDLIIYDLESNSVLASALQLKRNPPPPPPADSKKKKGSEPEETPPEEMGPLKLSVLGRMINAYREKIGTVLKSGCSYAPRCLPDYVQNKLKSVTDRDQETYQMFLSVDYSTISVLEEINQLMEPLRHATAYDVYLACPDIQNLVTAIQSEVYERVALESSRQPSYRPVVLEDQISLSSEPLDF
ncbi:uncharacterized protein [Ptychodera flava]|uniref:uncharacterized protein n=1 Tax=Ptychodera flava TaxID=63121 RepID=UPI00396A4C45